MKMDLDFERMNIGIQRILKNGIFKKIVYSILSNYILKISVVTFLFSFIYKQDKVLQTSLAAKTVSVTETILDSPIVDLAWCGVNHTTVIARTTFGRLYTSTNSGKSFTDITDNLQSISENHKKKYDFFNFKSVNVNNLNKTIVVILTNSNIHFVSFDSATTFMPLKFDGEIHTWQFHPKIQSYALFSSWSESCKKPSSSNEDCSNSIYVSTDNYNSFKFVAGYVVQYSWADSLSTHQNRIYYTHHKTPIKRQSKSIKWSHSVDFSYTDDFGERSIVAVPQGNKFLSSNGYLFIAKVVDVESQNVNLYISSDDGATYQKAILPVNLQEKSYTILDSMQGMISILVYHDETSNVGNVYVSDDKGIRYSLSLKNVVRTSTGECEFDKVLSLEGTFIANVKESNPGDEVDDDEDNDDSTLTAVDKRRNSRKKGKSQDGIRTLISFNKGGKWNYLRPPRIDSLGKKIDCVSEDETIYSENSNRQCHLHLHGISNFNKFAPFYSVENAVGIIIGTGNVGPYLRFENDQVNTYMSRDGGVTWIEAHKGAYVYELGDHGGMIVMVDDVSSTDKVIFSWNEGSIWYDFKVSKTPFLVDNIVIEPSSSSLEFLLYGTRDQSTGLVYHLNFASLEQPRCIGLYAADSVSSDYEHWTHTGGNKDNKCILGQKVTYVRRKSTSECYNGFDLVKPVINKVCDCTIDDYECDFGFTKKIGDNSCIPDGTYENYPSECTASSFYYANPYRKIPGDRCENGWVPSKAAVPCPPHSKFSKSAKGVLYSIVFVGLVLFGITYLTQNNRMHYIFKNYGFQSFSNVNYNILGGRQPESAASMNFRSNPRIGFIDSEKDEFEEEVPTLMNYTLTSSQETSYHKGSQISSDLNDYRNNISSPRQDTEVIEFQTNKNKNGNSAAKNNFYDSDEEIFLDNNSSSRVKDLNGNDDSSDNGDYSKDNLFDTSGADDSSYLTSLKGSKQMNSKGNAQISDEFELI